MLCPETWRSHSVREHASTSVRLTSPGGIIEIHLLATPLGPRTTLDAYVAHMKGVLLSIMATTTASPSLPPLRTSPAPRMVRSSQQKAGGVDWRIVLHRFADGDGTDHYSLAMLTVKERRGYMVRAIVSVGDWPRAREQVRELLQTVLVF